MGGDGGASLNQAFEFNVTKFHNVTPPPRNFITAVAIGINNVGEIVGSDDNGGFAFKAGKFQSITFPGTGVLGTGAWGINDMGIVVGNYEACSPCAFHGYALMNGKYISFDYPGAVDTFADGINSSGQIVGSYSLDGQTFHGFVTSPVTAADFEPANSIH